MKSYVKSYITKVSLTMRNIRAPDFGTYLCVAKNSLGESDGTIKLSGKCYVKHILSSNRESFIPNVKII